MDGIQLGDVNEVCKSNDHFSGMTEVQFSTIGDKFDTCGTRRGINHHFASARGLLDHRGVHGDGAGLESCWSPSGWEHVGSTSDSLENSGAGLSIGRICRAWDCWDNSLIYHGRSVDTHRQFSGSDWGIEEVGLIPGDNQVTSKESFSSSPPTISFTSRASNKLEVAASDIQDDQKSLCVEEKNNWDNKSPHASDFPVKIEMNPGSALVTEQTKSNATIHRSQEMEVRVNSSDRNVPSAFQHNSSHQQVGFLSGDERGIGPGTDEVKQLVKKEMQMDGSASLTGSGDASIGLKLGKRTYFEDSVASGSNNRGSSGPSLTSSPPGKKQKASSPGTSVPRCQAEGCKADLTNSKDYHRRHKVCECHSKASKVKVADMEQRFCQQCSRFHILSEFDEGKRSCRRRLAGHNERRRKPQPPEGLPLGHCAFLPDYKRLNGNLLDRTCLMQHQRAAMVSSYLHPPALPCQYYVSGAETQPFLSVLSQPATDQMLMLLRSPKEPHSNLTSHEAHEFLQGTGPIMGQGLALSKPPGAIHPSLDAFPASQSLSGIPDSGRALSLLSSSWGSTNPMCSMSLGPSSHSSSLEHFLSENQSVSSQQMVPCTSPPGGQSCFSQIPEKLTAVAPQSCMNLVHGSLDTMDMGQPEGSVNSNFDRRSVLVMLQEHEFQGLQEVGSRHGRPNIDLMQVPSPQSQSSHPGVLQVAAKGRYVELEGLRPYESIFDRQHIL